tara:strand:- start:1530 stop:2444 length:915 start_codon:yes stop_codon:yes gene_type:complete
MRHRLPLLLFIFFTHAFVSLSVHATTLWPKQTQAQRIVSLAPNITETLFALGAGEQLIAVTDYCDYPLAALALPKIGRGLSPSLESILALKPDLVILSASQQKLIQQLEQLHISTQAVKSRTLQDIRQTIITIGQASGRQQESVALLTQFDSDIRMVQQKVSNQPRPHVMISMGHSLGNNTFKQFYIAGQQDFYNDLINLAGGKNVYQKPFPKVPSISLEGLYYFNPDVIIDIFPESDDHTVSLMTVRQQWLSLKEINAIKNNHLHIIEADYATIPGPRVIELLFQFAALLHPELNWPTRMSHQ